MVASEPVPSREFEGPDSSFAKVEPNQPPRAGIGADNPNCTCVPAGHFTSVPRYALSKDTPRACTGPDKAPCLPEKPLKSPS